jgi:Tfp pilus assembly protein PilZ
MDNLVPHCRRKEVRIPYSGTVRYSADQFNWYLKRARNVGKKGIFIETEEKFKVGTKLYLNFDLSVDGSVVKKIKTIGEVVWLDVDGKEGSGNEVHGLGIFFSLLPNQATAMRIFVGEWAGSLSERSSPLPLPSKQVYIGLQRKPVPLLRWWLQEAVNKILSTNGLILELAVILIFIVIGVIFFS